MKTSEQIHELAAALALAQGELEPAKKEEENPAFSRPGRKAMYADLPALIKALRPVLPKYGLSYFQEVATHNGGVGVTTRLMHKSGQFIETDPLVITPERPTAHGIGSASSYGKRYQLGGATGAVAEEDDDGNAASGEAKDIRGQWKGKGPRVTAPQGNAPGVDEEAPFTNEPPKALGLGTDGKRYGVPIESVDAPLLRELATTPDQAADQLRETLRLKASRLADLVDPEHKERATWAKTYLGTSEPKAMRKADPSAWNDLVRFLEQKCRDKGKDPAEVLKKYESEILA